MNYDTHIRTYAAGERHCPICSDPLPAHQTWPGVRHRLCGKPECNEAFKSTLRVKYIGASERRCETDDCDKFLPAGWYWFRPTRLSCSPECWLRRHSANGPRVLCGCGCGNYVQRIASTISADGLNFIDRAHWGEYNANRTFGLCGPFTGVVKEYLGGFAALHYRDPKKHKPRLLPLFQFLTEKEFTDLEDVTPQTVTAFLDWGRSTGRQVVAYSSGTLSTFFKWMISEGRRKAPNPVISLIHKAPVVHRLPRPLEATELDFMWTLLKERGNARVRFAAAVAEEAGLRIGEICNIRLTDIDPLEQRLFVRLPNKTNKERWAFFSEKTKRYFVEWMAERDQSCVHDHVLHNNLLDAMTTGTMTYEFNHVLCKTCRGEKLNEVGFDKWSMHRLRHTMASNLVSAGANASTVMAAGGWKSHEAMAVYARVDQDLARRGYDEAMRRAKEKKQTTPRRTTLTTEELLKRKGLKTPNQSPSRDRERCV